MRGSCFENIAKAFIMGLKCPAKLWGKMFVVDCSFRCSTSAIIFGVTAFVDEIY